MSTNVATKVTLSDPWNTYQRKLAVLFNADPDIEVGEIKGEDGNFFLTVVLHSEKKYRAFSCALPKSVTFGNVNLDLILDFQPRKDKEFPEIIADLFEGNGNVFDIKNVSDPAKVNHKYIRFKPEVLQFFNDELQDMNGNWSGLAQDIARQVICTSGTEVHFCTAPKSKK